jgi:hypothetical protein
MRQAVVYECAQMQERDHSLEVVGAVLEKLTTPLKVGGEITLAISWGFVTSPSW